MARPHKDIENSFWNTDADMIFQGMLNKGFVEYSKRDSKKIVKPVDLKESLEIVKKSQEEMEG